MITLIISIISWCNPKNKSLGKVAAILSFIGLVADAFLLIGSLQWKFVLIDLIIFIINISNLNDGEKK